MNVVIATGETCPSETDEVQGESYEKREYWEELYASHRNREDFELYRFDWYFEVRNPFFKQILLNLLSPQKSDQILHLGCGKSSLQVCRMPCRSCFSHSLVLNATALVS